MGVKRTYNLAVPKPGRDKPFWITVGKLMEMDDGRMTVKLDTIPVGMVDGRNGPEPWDGWISVFEQNRDRDGGSGYGKSSGGQGQSGGRSAASRMGGSDLDDEIPF